MLQCKRAADVKELCTADRTHEPFEFTPVTFVRIGTVDGSADTIPAFEATSPRPGVSKLRAPEHPDEETGLPSFGGIASYRLSRMSSTSSNSN